MVGLLCAVIIGDAASGGGVAEMAVTRGSDDVVSGPGHAREYPSASFFDAEGRIMADAQSVFVSGQGAGLWGGGVEREDCHGSESLGLRMELVKAADVRSGPLVARGARGRLAKTVVDAGYWLVDEADDDGPHDGQTGADDAEECLDTAPDRRVHVGV